MDKYILTVLYCGLTSFMALGQSELNGKYTREDHPGGYLTFDSNKNFKFRFKSHAYWDLACGQFEVKNDTIFFTYTSDMFDETCNHEGINMTDTSDYFLRQGVDKRWRPIIAIIKKNKIQIIKTDGFHEPETAKQIKYYYERARRRYH